MRMQPSQSRLRMQWRCMACVRDSTAVLLLTVLSGAALAQTAGVAQTVPGATAASQTTTANPTTTANQAATANPATSQVTDEAGSAHPARQPNGRDRQRATKLYLEASKVYLNGQFEKALAQYEQAASLDPTIADYRLAADVARSHAVMALIQTAAKDRLASNEEGARVALAHARELDPKNPEIAARLDEMGDDAVRGLTQPLYAQAAGELEEAVDVAPAPVVHSFNQRGGAREIIRQVFKTYGLDAMLDDSIRDQQIRFEIEDASFTQAMRALNLVTGTFYVAMDAHRVLVARDTRENRDRLTPQSMETAYLGGLTADELTEVSSIAKNIFGVEKAAIDPTANTITLRAPPRTLSVFNTTLRELLDGHNQILLEVRIIQLAHTSTRNTGVQPPQTMSAFNVYTEEQSILNANQSLVQQIISSGLASPSDPLAIVAILVAAGDVSSSLFTNGLAMFGGGLTQSALSPGGTTLNFNLNSSDTRQLDLVQMRLNDGQEGTLKEGSKYPIQTSSYSSLSSSASNIPGLTGAGNSSSLTSLLASLSGSASAIPMIQYQDLGLTMKVTPSVMRNGEVSLSVDMKIDALSGQSLNGNPILSSQAFAGVVTVKQGETVEMTSELNKSQSRTVSGTPGMSEIPGLSDAAANDNQKNYASLLILVTPQVIRSTMGAGHTPMLLVEKNGPQQ
jgi:general secretion pathway protein D